MSEPATVPTESVLRREPYRVFFPLGVLLAWGGILHWLFLSLGWLHEFKPVFHSIAQIQGFLACFAVGFLFTAIPRRTGTAPPAPWQMVVGVVAPVGTTVAAWYDKLAVSQLFWALLLVMLIGFARQRFRSATATRRPPNSFVWVPVALLMGLVGTVFTAALGIDPESEAAWLWHECGRLFILQGVFLGLIMGLGGMLLPLITCGDAPPDAQPADRRVRLLHLLAALALVGSFVVEVSGQVATAYGVRGLLVLVVLLLGARIWRLPQKPGWHRWLVWLSAWAIPAGYLYAAAVPWYAQAGLHVVFVAGFALMALAVGIHVSLAHGGRPDLVHERLWQVPVFGLLVLLAVVCRVLATVDTDQQALWRGSAAGAFLIATVIWATLIGRSYPSRSE
ncbi:MAG: NnrS family protein [Planctomycetota bacterium]|jgi:uncharacterized protein involved in response to NO